MPGIGMQQRHRDADREHKCNRSESKCRADRFEADTGLVEVLDIILRMPLQPEQQQTFSVFDIVVKSLPVLAALATAVLSLWRESNKRRLDIASGETTTATEPWKRIGASGWTLIALAAATCATGLYSGFKDLQDAAIRSGENAALIAQVSQARQETIDAKKETIAATQASAGTLKKNEDTHATELHKQQELTFVSLLSSVSETAYAIVELDLPHAIPPYGKLGLVGSNVAEILAQTNDDNWRYSLMFEPIFRFIKWSDSVPMECDAYVGDWPMHNEANDTRRWGAGVAVKDRAIPNPTNLAGSMEVRDFRHLIIRLPRLDGQSMLDLWQGPEEGSLQLHIWVQLNDVADEATRQNIEALASKAITKATAFYTISAKSGLCKKAVLNLYNIHAASNQLRVEYIGTKKIDTVSCPAYVTSPQELY